MQMSIDEQMIITLTELMKEMKRVLWIDPKNPIDISCGNQCHIRTLKYAIANVKNVHDPRTINKWISRLVEFEFIRMIRKDWYKILNDGHDSIPIEAIQIDTQTPIKKEEITTQQANKEFDTIMEDLK